MAESDENSAVFEKEIREALAKKFEGFVNTKFTSCDIAYLIRHIVLNWKEETNA